MASGFKFTVTKTSPAGSVEVTSHQCDSGSIPGVGTLMNEMVCDHKVG